MSVCINDILSYSGESLATMVYENGEISRCRPEWTDCDSQRPDPQAVFFVERMWPKFVEALVAASSHPAEAHGAHGAADEAESEGA